MRRILGPLVVVAALVGLTACHERPNGTTIRMAYANDHTTGPEVAGLNEDRLPVCRGATSPRWVITGTRTIANCRVVGGTIIVSAPNVQLRNMVILGNAALLVDNRSTGLLIENTIIGARGRYTPVGGTNEPCGAAVGYGNYTLRRVEVHGCSDGVKVSGVVEVFASWFHDAYRGCGPSGCTHNDTAQKNDNAVLTRFVFRHNAAYANPCTSNRHFQLKNLRHGSLDIRSNFFYGAHGIANIDGSAGNNTGTISGNVYAGTHARGPFSSQADGSGTSPGLYTGLGMSGLTTTGNRFEDGFAAPRTGDVRPYLCVRG